MQPLDPSSLDRNSEDELHESSVRSKYLVYSLCGELYGSALLQIKEVIKMPAIKPVPHTERHFVGVINLRGQIISVLDLRKKFQMTGFDPSSGLILVVEGGNGQVGAVVDTIEFVREIPPEQVQRGDTIDTKIPRDQFIGVGKSGDQLIHLIDLARTVAVFQNTAVEESKKGAA